MNSKAVDNPKKKHLIEKRNELIWALEAQDYNLSEIGTIFNVNRSTILRIMDKKPSGWVTPYFKVTSIK